MIPGGYSKLPLTAQREPTPGREKQRREGRECDCDIKALLWVYLIPSPSLHQGLPSGGERKGFSYPSSPLAYGLRWGVGGVESLRIPHRRLANVPIVCISSVGRTAPLLLSAFYASGGGGRLFFLPLENLPRKEYVAISNASSCVVTISCESRLQGSMLSLSKNPNPFLHSSTNTRVPSGRPAWCAIREPDKEQKRSRFFPSRTPVLNLSVSTPFGGGIK